MIDPPILAIKKQLASEIVAISEQTNFFVAATELGLGPARLSDLRHGRVERFTIDRLVRVLATVDRRVDVSIAIVGPREVRWMEAKLRAMRERQKHRMAGKSAVDCWEPVAKSGKRMPTRLRDT